MAVDEQELIAPLPPIDVGYKGADRNTRTLNRFKPKMMTPEKAIAEDHDVLIGRVNDLHRNNGLVAGALRKITDKVIGHQFLLDLRPDYDTLGISREVATDWSLSVARRWNAYALGRDNQIDASRRMNFVGLLRAGYGSFWLNGDMFLTREFFADQINKRDAGKAATCFSLIDPDRICDPKNQAEMQSQDIRRGVHVNDFGQALGYWLASRSEYGIAKKGFGQIGYKYIPRRNENFLNVIHMFEVATGGTQSRGVSRLASIVERVKQTDRMTTAELEAAIANAMLSYYIKSDYGPESAYQALGAQEGGAARQQMEYRAEWARMSPVEHDGNKLLHLYLGEDVGQLKGERGASIIGEFNKEMKREISSAMGASYSSATNDWTAASFASLKAELAEEWSRVLSERETVVIPAATLMFQAWLDEMILRKIIVTPAGMNYMENREFLTRCRWIGAAKPVFDSTSEATAQNIKLANKSISPYQVALEGGYELREVLDDHKEFNDELFKRELTVTSLSQQSVNQAGQTGQNI